MTSRKTAAKVAMLIVIIIIIVSVTLPSYVRAQCTTPCSYTYSPKEISNAYDVSPLIEAGYTGQGATVALVNSGIDSAFYTDLDTFSNHYGLPALSVSVVRPYGPAGTNAECGIGSGETTADAESIHAMAPDAKILLVLTGFSPSAGCAERLIDGFSYVINNDAASIAVLSPSSGVNRATAMALNSEYAKSVAEGITLIAASNDWGSNNTCCGSNPSPGYYLMPQYSPYVTAVGGTVLYLNASGGYGHETGWSHSGGGPSPLFPEPHYQVAYPGVPQNGARNIPDVALPASCQLSIYTPTYPDKPQDGIPGASDWWGFCGTSASAPTFAGIVADIVQEARNTGFVSSTGGLGFLNPTLYRLGSGSPEDPSYPFHDVTKGCSLVGPNNQIGYCAHTGWDFVTGWGSIDAMKLAQDIHHNPSTTTVEVAEFQTESILFVIVMPFVLAARPKRFHNQILN
ncbi:MAG TPA: S53 family peptidase [Candidatus Bathyarchaeia archaeon]|nr:S53 family peptidase [Candidatus Bathyarchaeia archaeon]